MQHAVVGSSVLFRYSHARTGCIQTARRKLFKESEYAFFPKQAARGNGCEVHTTRVRLMDSGVRDSSTAPQIDLRIGTRSKAGPERVGACPHNAALAKCSSISLSSRPLQTLIEARHYSSKSPPSSDIDQINPRRSSSHHQLHFAFTLLCNSLHFSSTLGMELNLTDFRAASDTFRGISILNHKHLTK